jgi:hypothetical protein
MASWKTWASDLGFAAADGMTTTENMLVNSNIEAVMRDIHFLLLINISISLVPDEYS